MSPKCLLLASREYSSSTLHTQKKEKLISYIKRRNHLLRDASKYKEEVERLKTLFKQESKLNSATVRENVFLKSRNWWQRLWDVQMPID